MTGTLQTDSSRRFFFATPFPEREDHDLRDARSVVFSLPFASQFCERVAAFTVSWPGLSRPRAQRTSSAPAIVWRSAGRSAPPAGSVFTMSKSKTELGTEVGSATEQNKNIFATGHVESGFWFTRRRGARRDAESKIAKPSNPSASPIAPRLRVGFRDLNSTR